MIARSIPPDDPLVIWVKLLSILTNGYRAGSIASRVGAETALGGRAVDDAIISLSLGASFTGNCRPFMLPAPPVADRLSPHDMPLIRNNHTACTRHAGGLTRRQFFLLSSRCCTTGVSSRFGLTASVCCQLSPPACSRSSWDCCAG
jgi:hypothetical protein